MDSFGPSLPETRVTASTLIRRERRLPVRGDIYVTIGRKLKPADVLGRANPPVGRRAISLTRVLGVREAEVPRRLHKQAGDMVEPREIIIAKPINFGLQQLVYRSPGAGRIVAIQGSWMVIDLEGQPVELKALYRGNVAGVMPCLGAVIEGQGTLIQGIWGSGKEGCGALRMTVRSADEILDAPSLPSDARGTVVIGGAGITQEALRRADTLKVEGVILGALDPDLKFLAEQVSVPVIVTEGFGRIPMCVPIFEKLVAYNGQEVAVNGQTRQRGGAARPEVFIPDAASALENAGVARQSASLTVEPGTPVRVTREPYLGRTGRLSDELRIQWTTAADSVRLPSMQVELRDAHGTERVIIPWTNLELIG